MATQLQRAYGLGDDRREFPKGSEAKVPKKERADKKAAKGDPFEGLPRRPIGVDRKG